MNNMYKYILALLLLVSALTPTLIFANKTLTPDNFAFTAKLSDADNSLREVTLPASILESMQRKDFGDLRVFNAQVQEVPHQFRRITTDNQSIKTTLNFYPFNREEAADPASIRIQIMQNSGNQSISVESDQQQPHSSNEFQYIAENRNDTQSLCELNLNWDQPRPSMILPIKVEGSNNLQNWSILNNSANLSMLDYAGSKLIRSRVSIACSKHDYLRITWLKPEQGLKLNSITAIYKQPQKNVLQQKNIGKPHYGSDGNWYFETNSAAPITQLELIAPTDGLLYKGSLYSRPDDSSQWRYQQSITQYRLKVTDTRLTSAPLKLHANNENFWKIELASEQQLTNAQLPDIQLGWLQQKLIFLAQGEPPFTLAYGNLNIAPESNNGINHLIKTLRDAGETPDMVNLEEPINNRTIAKLKKSTPWKLIGLWLLLIVGTAVLGYMAYQLYQQMNNK